jgi:F-type H+-transporting ATPase subunit epsilon
VLAPGSDGYLGILANHAPLVTSLDIGLVNYTPAGGGQDQLFAVANGFLEVSNNKVSILADSAESWDEIDLERAQEAVKRAEERLSIMDESVDIERAQIALKRALNRIRIKQKKFTF